MCSEKEALHRGKELYIYYEKVSKPIASKPIASKPIASKPELLDLLSFR